MQFSYTDAAIEQPNRCNTFYFSPSARAVSFSQKRQDSNLVADGYYFNIGDLADDLKVHQEPLYPCHSFMEARANYASAGIAQKCR